MSNWIKPGAKTKELVGTMENDFTCLEKSDVIVINGGANDVNSMRSQTISAVGNMASFAQKYNNTIVIVIYLQSTSSIGYNPMDMDIVTVHNINTVILSTHMMGLITINTGI